MCALGLTADRYVATSGGARSGRRKHAAGTGRSSADRRDTVGVGQQRRRGFRRDGARTAGANIRSSPNGVFTRAWTRK